MSVSELLADCDARGIRLLPAGDGGLTIDSPAGALTPKLLDRMKACKAGLLAILRAGRGDVHTDSPRDGGRISGPLTQAPAQGVEAQVAPSAQFLGHVAQPITELPAAGRVCRCGSVEWRDVPIHNGESTRRDCARCERFISFPVWHGRDLTNINMCG